MPVPSRAELLDLLRGLTPEEQVIWMVHFGAELTIAAREGYEYEGHAVDPAHLIRVNELLHRVFGRIRTLQRGSEWTLESFVDMVYEAAFINPIHGVSWALNRSMPTQTVKPN